MPHQITAIILKGNYNKIKAENFGLLGKELGFDLNLFHINHYQTAYWQYELKTVGELETAFGSEPYFGHFPTEVAIAEVVKQISEQEKPEFAIILTDYFGGFGSQYASVFQHTINVDKNIQTISKALAYLGVIVTTEYDEFDTVGLSKIRSQPDYLRKYSGLAEEYDL